jgi:hypothetical protein
MTVGESSTEINEKNPFWVGQYSTPRVGQFLMPIYTHKTVMSISGSRSPIGTVTSSNNDFQYWQNSRSYIPPLSIFDRAIIGACAARIRFTTASRLTAWK